MDSPISNLVQSYTTLASSVIEKWTELASKAASKADAGAYDATSAAEDAAAGATLAAEAAGLWAEWAYESLTTLMGVEGGSYTSESEPFKAEEGSALKLAGPLARGPGGVTLPLNAVTINPEQLDSDDTEFTLRADGSGLRGGTYVGEVEATTDTGTSRVAVWITIP